MKKFCRKGHLKRSGKRWLALLMSVCLIGTMIPITARAENGSTETGLCEHHTEHTTECGYVAPAWGHECGHVHDESCGYQEASECNHVHTEECGENGENCAHVHTSECSYAEEQACSHVHDEECGYVESSEGSPCTFVCDICGKEAEPGENNLPDETLTQTPGKLITAWQWIDEEGILDEETGNLALPGANAQTPAYFEDVTAFLPTQIQATVEEDTEAEAANKTITLGEWSCDSYPEEGAYQGYYTFAAALPEGYALSEEAEALEVLVELGGAQMYENSITATKPSVGDGFENNPYQISTAAELYWFAACVNGSTEGIQQNKSANAVLTANITVNSNLLSLLQFDSETGEVTNGENFTSWTPIGNRNNQYTGTFDGQGHTISGLYFNTSTEFVGLFGLVESGGSVSNVGVVDSYFKGEDLVGGVCGLNYSGTITNCYNTGTVSGSRSCVGGVCGRNSAPSNRTATITNCYNTGAVSGTGHQVGGVCGSNDIYGSSYGTVTITNCYNRGTVSGSGNRVGGVCGYNSAQNSSNGTATITNCYNTGNVTATGTDNDYVGGVCGFNVARNATATITNCYYLANTADENGGKTTKQFKSGEVCYLLNGSTSTNPVWYQLLETENYPNLDITNSANRTVYQCAPCTGVFSNTEDQTAEHSCVVDTNDSTKHICENCGDTHDAVFTANDETNTISVCCGLGSVTLKAPTELTYDGTAKAATVEGELTGFDTPKILYKEKDSEEAAVEIAPTNAGTYVASITYTIGKNTTYSVSVEYTIGKASVTVKAKNYTVKFGNPLPESLEYETDGLMGTDTLSSIGANVTIGYKNAVTPSAIGIYIIVVSGEAATTNYNLTYVNDKLTIIEKPAQTITAADIELSYGDAGKKIGAATSGDGAITYAVKTGEDVIDVAADGTITALKVGTATVEITAAGTFDYAKATTTVTVTVNKAAVTIKADDKTVYQNAALPTFTYSVTGLANGDTLSFTPVLTCEAANTSTVGTYAITVSIEITEDECYTYTTQNGTLTVQKKSSGSGDNSGGSTVDGGNADDSTDAGNGYINPGTGKPTVTPGIPAQGTDPAPGIGNGSKPGSKPATDTGETTEAPFIRGENGKEGWDVIRDEVNRTQEGKTVTVDMNGSAVVPGDVLDEIKGKDITIVFDMGNGITWSVNGQSITSDKIGDIDFSVKVGTNTIPVDVINNVTGERQSKQISLAYDGEFGFTAVLSINMEASNAGMYANLFYFNEKIGELEFICADEIAADGTAELTFIHASDYAIVIDKESMEGSVQIDSPASESQDTETESTQTGAEVSNDAWNPWWIIVIGIMVIVIGLGVFLVAKKNKSDDE